MFVNSASFRSDRGENGYTNGTPRRLGSDNKASASADGNSAIVAKNPHLDTPAGTVGFDNV